MRLDDFAGDRQAETHAALLGRGKRLEQPLGQFRRDSRAGIGDSEFHRISQRSRGDLKLAPIHRFGSDSV